MRSEQVVSPASSPRSNLSRTRRRTRGHGPMGTSVPLSESAARIQLDFRDNPESIQKWFVFALMADLTRHHHCRFLDTDRLTYSNGKLAEWEAAR